MSHARFSPSGASKWMACAGALQAEKGFSDSGSSAAAREGTAAHFMAEKCLLDNTDAAAYVGERADNGVEMTEVMADFVQIYVDYARSYKGYAHVEQRVDISPWAKGSFGTADYVLLQPQSKKCHVIDLKYGVGIQVFAEANKQLMMYALGAYKSFDFLFDIEEFVLHIGQPRLDHFDSWTLKTADLLAFGDEVIAACEAALKPDPPRTPGEIQCRWCRAKNTCRDRAEHALNQVSEFNDDFSLFEVRSSKLTIEEIARVLPYLSEITKWVNDMKAYVASEAERGTPIPGHKLVAGRSNRRWASASEAAHALLLDADLSDDQIYVKKIISPTQAEKLIGKNHELLASLVIKPQGRPILVPDDDKRSVYQAYKDDIALLD